MLALTILKLTYILCFGVNYVATHGYLLDPPQRSSLWRALRGMPKNYDDNGLNCGGFKRQWKVNDGKCGICGDPYDIPIPRPNEDGGTFGRGVISRRYVAGDIIDTAVMITANHFGWFEFRLCPHDNINVTVTSECFNKNLLLVSDRKTQFPFDRTRFYLNDTKGLVYLKIKLPEKLTCAKCVLQWKYNTGNSWGCDKECCGLGCGKQEQFINCADIKITQSKNIAKKSGSVERLYSESDEDESDESDESIEDNQSDQKQNPDAIQPIKPEKKCLPFGIWRSVSFMKQWCKENCHNGNCPKSHCICK